MGRVKVVVPFDVIITRMTLEGESRGGKGRQGKVGGYGTGVDRHQLRIRIRIMLRMYICIRYI